MKYHAYLGSLEKEDYLSNFQKGLEFIEFGKKVSHNTKIFIKPNLTYPEYRPGVMTNPEAVSSSIQAISDYTSQIWIGDSDSGGYNRFSMDNVYIATGLKELCTKNGAKIVNLSKLQQRPIQFQVNGKQIVLDLPVLLTDEVDFTVTMPVPKIHCNTIVSLSFKNQWGCIPENRDRLRLHPYFSQVILEVNNAIHTNVVMMDGKYGLNRNGPMKGSPVKLDWSMVTDNIGCAEKLGCDLMQIPLMTVPHLRYIREKGLIPKSEEIILNQDIAPFRKTRFYLHRNLTDYPGMIAFKSPFFAYIAYFSPVSKSLHKLLYLVREPFYDYDKH
jgi:uncharacterized protein (DUF362 family)